MNDFSVLWRPYERMAILVEIDEKTEQVIVEQSGENPFQLNILRLFQLIEKVNRLLSDSHIVVQIALKPRDNRGE